MNDEIEEAVWRLDCNDCLCVKDYPDGTEPDQCPECGALVDWLYRADQEWVPES